MEIFNLNSSLDISSAPSYTEIFNLNSSLDTSSALSGIYLWLLFGYLSSTVSCDIQKLIHSNLVFRHIICVVAFFLLFAVIDTETAKLPLYIIWLKTLFVYIIFIAMVKNKLYFSLPILFLLIVDQNIKIHANKLDSTDRKKILYNNIRNYINYTNIGIIIIGFIHYIYRQYREFGDNFSLTKLLFDYKCSTS